MSVCLKKLQKMLMNFSVQKQNFLKNKQFIWTLFCVFVQIHRPKTLVESFNWLISIFICYFGKFYNTISLKDFVEALFHFKLDLTDFNKKLSLIKSVLLEFAQKTKSDGSFFDITSQETHSNYCYFLNFRFYVGNLPFIFTNS